jgi:hypothetical protein
MSLDARIAVADYLTVLLSGENADVGVLELGAQE